MASVWVIGDTHGSADKLAAVLRALPRKKGDWTVFLGDYIDRGPDSAGVVRRALAEYTADPDHTILLWGNHEDMAASHFHVLAPSQLDYDSYDWFRNGGTIALQSWGLTLPDLFVAPCPAELSQLFPLLRTYFRGADTGIAGLEPFLFVHAGILPGWEPEESDGETLLWVREEFLHSFDPSGRIVVHGHTPFEEVRVHPDKIGIDTGVAYGGPLTALQLPERIIYQADDQGTVTVSDLPEFPTSDDLN